MPAQYRLEMPAPETHLFHVTVTVIDAPATATDLVLPSWLPGWYIISDNARHIQGFAAFDLDNRPRVWAKVDKARWRVDNDGRGFRVRYQVYANHLAVFASHLDESHALFNGVDLFMYVDGAKDEPCLLSVTPPPDRDWRVTLTLDPADGDSTFYAPDYHSLVDSPGEIGTHRVLPFEVDGLPHGLALYGHGNEDADRLVADLARIVATARDVCGELPYPWYTFVLLLGDRGTGGMEHARCSINHVSRFTFQPRRDYERVLSLLSHEFFHVWNVKRIRPVAFDDYDYEREMYTGLLWVVEGATSYYDDLILARAGLLTPERFLERLGEDIHDYERTPARELYNLTEASFDTWLKMYRQYDNAPNTRVNFYLKGALVHLLLDLEIRHRTQGTCSLDDVFRALWADYKTRGAGYADGEYKTIVEGVVGGRMDDFWARYVDGRAALDFDTPLAEVGLRLTRGYKADKDRERTGGRPGVERGYLGATTRMDNGRLLVQTAYAGSPAQAAGLTPGDELLALDGVRLTEATLAHRLDERAPGETVTVTVFRRDELQQVPVTLGVRPPDDYRIEALPGATAEQRARFRAWLGVDLPLSEPPREETP